MKPNAILFSRVDREDLCVAGGLVFKVNNTVSYEDAYNEIKHKLETPKLINHIIEDRWLFSDLFEDDETYKFISSRCTNALYFLFENKDGEQKKLRFSADFVLLNE